MGMTFFKRFRMEIDLVTQPLWVPPVPPRYRLVPWHPDLLLPHADTKYRSFREEIDASVFPCLGELDGCRKLMKEIAAKEGFLGDATWLAQHYHDDREPPENCGTIQGVRDPCGFGAIQNLGITPEHRGQGLGTVLLLHALRGFREMGLRQAFLEVTAKNEGAVRLYARLGFRRIRTLYRAVEVAYT